jgi:hypothetical protein
MDEALTPSLFTQNRILIVTNAEKVTKSRLEDIGAVQGVAILRSGLSWRRLRENRWKAGGRFFRLSKSMP